MASQNPYEYYQDETQRGNYVYETLENMVNNFRDNQTGQNTMLGTVQRRSILYWMKKGIQKFTFDALREVKAIELELGDNLDIILPFDFISYIRISWLDQETGEFRPMAENRKTALAEAWLQDNEAEILFDNDGEVLKGSSATELLTLKKFTKNKNCHCQDICCCSNGQRWGMDTSKNYNGNFNIDTRQGRIHFGSESATKIIILEYISDGLEYSNESDIRVNKQAEMALYFFVKWNLLINKIGVNEYDKRNAKKDFDTEYRNAKIRMMNLKVGEIAQLLKERNKWIR